MSVLYIRDKTTGEFVPIKTIQGPQGPTGAVDGLDFYEGAPSALGKASPGVSDFAARGDHVHPLPSPADIGAATVQKAEDAYALAEEAMQTIASRLNPDRFCYISADSWTGTAAPYTCELNWDGVSAATIPIMDMIASSDPATAEEQEESYSKIYKVETSENKITLYAREMPTVDLNIQFLNT